MQQTPVPIDSRWPAEAPDDLPDPEAASWRQALQPWFRLILAGNPFYLISAVLVLWALYRLTVDPRFFATETSQLGFNFGSIQSYEFLLAGTAILLARRRLWYDSTLLVVLENVLVFAPFLLVSQAVFLDRSTLWVICAAACLCAGLRGWSLRCFLAELNLPSRLLACGAAFLAVNLAFPLVFRAIHAEGDALSGEAILFAAIRNAWRYLMPVLATLAVFLPCPASQDAGRKRWNWLPLTILTLWTSATAVHLAAIGYVYTLKWQWSLLVPTLWAASWTLVTRLEGSPALAGERWRRVALGLPVVIAWLAFSESGPRFQALMGLNAVLYLALWLRHRTDGWAGQLLLISVACLLAGAPVESGARWLPDFDRGTAVGCAVGGYLLMRAVLSASPVAGMLGGLVVLVGGEFMFLGLAAPRQQALQLALSFVVLHGLRWPIAEGQKGTRSVRGVLALAWVINSWLWPAGGDGLDRTPVWGAGALVLGCVCLCRLAIGQWPSVVVPVAGALVVIAPLGRWGAESIRRAPAGLLVLAAAFLMFGLGTIYALCRRRWLGVG